MALAAVALIGAAACSDSDAVLGPDGSGDGFVRALVVDQPSSSTSSAPSASYAPAAGEETSSFSGTVSGQFSVAVSADGVVWYSLGSPNGVAVSVQSTGDSTDVHGEVKIPAGTYARVRLIMRNAHANLEAGSKIGGLTLTTDVEVSIGGGGEIVIEKQIPAFTVSANASTRTEILFDLNSEIWLNQQNAEDGEASGPEVRDSTDARTRQSPRGDTPQ
jgi:hypothetical protein